MLKSFLSSLFFICFSLTSQAQEANFVMTQVGGNRLVNKANDLLYGPDDYLWVTERERGVVVRINPSTAERDELIKIDDVFSSSRQDGLLGMALHQDFLGEAPYLYLSYTKQVDGQRIQRIMRYTYSEVDQNGTLSDPLILLDNLPSSNDHNSGRMVFGPDMKLYYTIGDQGNNQNSNYCKSVVSQVIPSQAEIDMQDWTNYPGKILRLNLDGSIPEDNPLIDGVRSHIFTYGHRNAQGLVFGANGILYSDEHGPDTDDEVNIITAGGNYGWPLVAGYKDDQAYDYCNWSSLSNCSDLSFSKFNCPDGAEFLEESSFNAENFKEPLLSMFAVTDDYNFDDPSCENSWICRPNVAPSSLAIYEGDEIPGWKNSLLVSSLKRGKIFRIQLNDDGTEMVGDTIHQFYTTNRYRDIEPSPDGKSFYILTDEQGNTSGPDGLTFENNLRNPSAILKFTLQESVDVKEIEPYLLNIYPNPSKGSFTLEIDSDASEISGVLINTMGQTVQTNKTLAKGQNLINLPQVSSGIYLYKVTAAGKSIVKRVIIEK